MKRARVRGVFKILIIALYIAAVVGAGAGGYLCYQVSVIFCYFL